MNKYHVLKDFSVLSEKDLMYVHDIVSTESDIAFKKKIVERTFEDQLSAQIFATAFSWKFETRPGFVKRHDKLLSLAKEKYPEFFI